MYNYNSCLLETCRENLISYIIVTHEWRREAHNNYSRSATSLVELMQRLLLIPGCEAVSQKEGEYVQEPAKVTVGDFLYIAIYRTLLFYNKPSSTCLPINLSWSYHVCLYIEWSMAQDTHPQAGGDNYPVWTKGLWVKRCIIWGLIFFTIIIGRGMSMSLWHRWFPLRTRIPLLWKWAARNVALSGGTECVHQQILCMAIYTWWALGLHDEINALEASEVTQSPTYAR